MRKIALFLTVLMLFGCIPAALADGEHTEELPWMEETPQYVYSGTVFLTDATYPQVCITPFSADSLYSSFSKKYEPWYVEFPLPAGAVATEFKMSGANLADPVKGVQYYYEAVDQYAFETFLSKSKNPGDILRDGTNGVAAYIDKERSSAYALISTPEIGQMARLYVSLFYDHMNKMPESSKESTLRDGITAEISRIQNSMQVVQHEDHWTYDKYQGFRMASYTMPGLSLEMRNTVFEVPGADGEMLPAKLFVTRLDGERAELYAIADREKGTTVEVSVVLETNMSQAFPDTVSSDHLVTTVELNDGNEWGINALLYDGKPHSVAAGRVLCTYEKYGSQKTLYVTVRVTLHRYYFDGVDDIARYLNSILDQGFVFTQE